MTITPEMTIAEVMRLDPEVAPVFLSFGMHCLSAESIAQASEVHGVSAEDLVIALNEYFELKDGSAKKAE